MAAEPARHLRLVEVDNETGEAHIVESEALAKLEHELQRLQYENDKLKTDRKMLRRDVTAKNRKISELETDKAQQRLHHPDRALIEQVANFWHRLCRGSNARINPLSPARFDAVAGLVEMEEIVKDSRGKRVGHKRRYRPVDFEIAIRGARFDHYVKARKNGTEQHFDDLEFICRDSKNFEECMARCPIEVARACEARNTSGEGSTNAAIPRRQSTPEVPHGYNAYVVRAGHRVLGRSQARRHETTRGRVVDGHAPLPASWA